MERIIECISQVLSLEVPYLRAVWENLEESTKSTVLAAFIASAVIPFLFFYTYGLFVYTIDMFSIE